MKKCRKLSLNYHQVHTLSACLNKSYEPRHEKTNVPVSDLVRHKPGCTAKEVGKRLEILDFESKGIVPAM